MLELSWGEDFAALADVSRSAFARYSRLEDRANEVSFTDQVAQFAELGWLQLSAPDGGGAAVSEGVPLATIAAVFVEMGRALATTPLLDLITARDAALAAGSARANELAERIGDGVGLVFPALRGAAPGGSEWGDHLSFEGGVLSGSALAVGYADQADGFLVYADAGEGALVFVDAHDVTAVTPMPNLGDDPVWALTFGGVPVRPDAVLATGARARLAAATAGDRAAVLRAAQVYGASRRLLDITVRYAQERYQFGGPIGRFQAVQYLCTDIAVAAHLTSAHVRAAAAAIDAGRDAEPHLGLMRKQAAKTATHMVHGAHEVHAGIGYMVESNVHLFTNAAKRWQYDFGSDVGNDARIVAALEREYGAAQPRASLSPAQVTKQRAGARP